MNEVENFKLKSDMSIFTFQEKAEPSEWRCELFGMKNGYGFIPNKGEEPNWFWRWMQYLLVGNRWYKEGEE